MRREDVKNQFPEATDEQITAILNLHNSEITAEKNKAEQFKLDAEKVAGLQKELGQYKTISEKAENLQKQLDEMKAKSAETVKEKQTEVDESAKRIAELETQLNDLKSGFEKTEAELKKERHLKSLAQLNITGEDADNLIKDGELNYEALGKIISERESAAATKKEKDIAANATNPGGGSAGEPPKDEKTEDVKNAETINFGGLNKDAVKARDYYK